MTNITERIIVTETILTLLRDPETTISVNDGEEIVLTNSRSLPEILGAMFTTADDILIVRHPTNRSLSGWIQFIYGNDADVLSDHTISLNDVLEPIQALSNTLSEIGPHQWLLTRLVNQVREYNATLTTPTGDDYNALLTMVLNTANYLEPTDG